MNIALIWPRSTFLDHPMVWPPLGLMYLSSRLQSFGHTTEFFDCNIIDLPEYTDKFDQTWVSSTTPQILDVRRIVKIIKNWKTKTVLGGAMAWDDPDKALSLGFDLVVGGEADHPDNLTKILECQDKYLFLPVHRDLEWALKPDRRWALNYHSYMKDDKGNKYRMASMFGSRGCPQACIAKDQKVLMADWTYKSIQDIKIGDLVMSMHKNTYYGHGKQIAPTKVLAVMNSGEKETINIRVGNNILNCTPDHKVYVDDGYKSRWKRADSTKIGKTKFINFRPLDNNSDDFKKGWLSGYLAGDGCVHYTNKGYIRIQVTSRDVEMLDILENWFNYFDCKVKKYKHEMGNSIFPTKLDPIYIDGITCTDTKESKKILEVISEIDSNDYKRGWLAGMYDSDGYLSQNTCRIIQSSKVKKYNCDRIEKYLSHLGFRCSIQYRDGMNTYVMNSAKFLTVCRPMMKRKYPGWYYFKSLIKENVDEVYKGDYKTVYDLQTESHSFIVEGFIVHNCAFCSSGRGGKIWDKFTRYEPLEVMEQQIKELKEMGFGGIGFYDDILPLNKKRTLLLLDILKKYDMKWRCFLRTDIICKNGGKEYLEQMRDAGLIEIFIGVESADNRIKEAITKGTTIEQDTLVINWALELGITPKCSFILGLPSEDMQSMEKTREWILQWDLQKVRIQVDRLIQFPGTPIANHPEKYDLVWEKPVDEAYFYKGREDIDLRSFVHTSHLTSQQIDDFYYKLNSEMKERGFRS